MRNTIFAILALLAVAMASQSSAADTVCDGGNLAPAAHQPVATIPTDLPIGDGIFEKVSTGGHVDSLTLSEDGRYLAASENEAGQIVVWDIQTGKLIVRLSVTKPQCTLWRGDHLYVGNGETAEILAFCSSKKWKLDARYKIPSDAETLTAPRGKFYNGEIIGLSNASAFVLNIPRSSTTVRNFGLHGGAMVGVSYDGRTVVEQQNVGSTGEVTLFDYQSYISDKHPENQPSSASTGVIRQTRPGEIWCSTDGLWAGNPIAPLGGPMQKVVVPDWNTDVCYAIGVGSVECFKLDASMAPLGAYPYKLPERYAEYSRPETLFEPRPSFQTHLPAAVTLDKRLYLFAFSIETDEIYRYSTMTEAKPPVVQALRFGFPPKLDEGKSASFPLLDEKASGTFTVAKGPPGIRISKAGVVTWTPSKADVGIQDIKIRHERVGGEIAFLRFTTEVVSADVVAHAAADNGNTQELGRHFLLSEDAFMSPAANRGILLLDGNTLRVLDADGQAASAQLTLPDTYLRIFERKDCYIAQSAHAVDLLDHRTLKVRRHIAIDGQEITDMTCNPLRPFTYICAKFDDNKSVPLFRMVSINETTGEVDSNTGIFARRLVIDPSGRHAFLALEHLQGLAWKKGWIFADRKTWLKERGPYPASALIAYDISSTPWKFLNVNIRAADESHAAEDRFLGLALSADASHIAYLSFGGYDQGQTPVYSTRDVMKATIAFKGAAIRSFAWHPILDLVADTDEKTVRIFNAKTGVEEERRLDLHDEEILTPIHVMFSPGGRHLLVTCRDATDRLMVRAIPLVLDPAEARQLLAPPVHSTSPPEGPIADRIPTKVPATALEALELKAGPELSTKEIARQFSGAVAIVESRDGFGSGFFVGSKGYLVTCAHVLPKVGDPYVRLKSNTGAGPSESKLVATIIGKDEDLDLALLKVESAAALPFIQMAGGEVEAGDPVTVIGNPGLGHSVLDFTVTAGIVSNAKRTFFQHFYFQTNAAVNPGNSGGPVFNSHGKVIGVMVLKASIDNTALAIPADDVIRFLQSMTPEQRKVLR